MSPHSPAGGPRRRPPVVSRRRRLLGRLLPLLLGVVAVAVLSTWAVSGDSSHRDGHRPVASRSRRQVVHVPAPSSSALDPSAFSPGACVAFAPTAGDRHITVFLDAGHGGIDPGGVGHTEAGTTVTEAALTLPIEMEAAAALRGRGFRVVVSRTGATTVAALAVADVSNNVLTLQGAFDDVAARDQCADRAGAAVLLGIYFDAGYSQQNAGSVTGYDAARPFAAANQRFATLVQTDVLTALNATGAGIPDEGVLPDSALGSRVPTTATTGLAAASLAYHHLLLLGPAQPGYFTTPSRMPGALVEPLFITDPFEATIAGSAAGQRTIAGALAKAVTQYFAPTGSPATGGSTDATSS